MPRFTTGKHWSVTWNNPTHDVLETIAALEFNDLLYVFQVECGDELTIHYQMYVQFPEIFAFSLVREILQEFMPGCHIEKARSYRLTQAYCMKEESRIDGYWTNLPPEEIEMIKSRYLKINRVQLMKDDILKNKQSLTYVSQEYFDIFLRSGGNIQKFFSMNMFTARTRPTNVVYLYSSNPGTGKSRFAYDVAQACGSYYYKNSGKWWDLYSQEQVVVWDDFRASEYALGELLKLCDRYPYIVQYKGGSMHFNSRLLILTSNISFDSLYERVDNAPLLRRIALPIDVNTYDGEILNGVNLKTMEAININVFQVIRDYISLD